MGRTNIYPHYHGKIIKGNLFKNQYLCSYTELGKRKILHLKAAFYLDKENNLT